MEDKNNFNREIAINVEPENSEGLSPENQKAFESLVQGIEVIESENKKAIDVAEIETGKILGDIDAPPEAYLKINSINKTLKEALLGKPPKGSKMRKFFLGVGMTLLTQIPSFGANTEDTSGDVLVNENSIEMDISDPLMSEADLDKETFNYTDKVEVSDDKEDVIGVPEEHKMEFKTNFEMGSAEMSQETIDAFKAEVADFIDTFSLEDLEKIINGELVVQIPVGSSHHNVNGEQITLGKSYTNNYELAQIRGDEVMELSKEAFAEKGIHNPIIMVDISVVEGKEPGVSASDERFAGVNVVELTYENMANIYDTIVVDPSGSMADDRLKIEGFAEGRAEIVELETRKERGDTRENIFNTMKHLVDRVPDGEKIAFITDEGDNSKFETQDFIDLMDKAKGKGISITGIMISPENPNEKIQFDYLKMIHAMKDKGGKYGDINAFNQIKRILDIRRSK